MYGRPRPELAGKVDPFAESGKGAAIAQIQKEQAIEDSLIACTFGNSGLNLQKYAEFLMTATGIHELADSDYLLQIGERIVCLERCFNVREGFRREHDLLPQRMTSEPLKNAGPSTDQVVKAQEIILDEYYTAFGYSKNGIPRIDKLTELGLHKALQDISEHL